MFTHAILAMGTDTIINNWTKCFLAEDCQTHHIAPTGPFSPCILVSLLPQDNDAYVLCRSSYSGENEILRMLQFSPIDTRFGSCVQIFIKGAFDEETYLVAQPMCKNDWWIVGYNVFFPLFWLTICVKIFSLLFTQLCFVWHTDLWLLNGHPSKN